MPKRWSDVNAIYQIYPRSFMDSNGDGIGDLRGVIRKLEYFKAQKDSLGIDAIWFSPIFKSPMMDMGYDVSDYCDINPEFGTLDEFKELVQKSHELGIKVMLDYVPNHTSALHPWFLESKKSKVNRHADYYVWRDGKKNGEPPNNWLSIFGGSAWEWCEERRQYYLHTFLKDQPDLNWDNPIVRAEMKEVIRFWLDLGVDGIRADAVRFISKDPKFRDDIKSAAAAEDISGAGGEYDHYVHKYSRFWKNLFPYLQELAAVVEEYDERIMIFEDYPDGNYSTREQYLGFYGINPNVSAPFNFEGIWTPFDAAEFRTFVTEFQGMLDPDVHIPVYCFGNHDQWRLATRMGGEEQARLIALLQMALPGLPTIYYGDELGMPNTPIHPSEVQDLRAFSSGQIDSTRDFERSPMQWHKGEYAGFSTSKPWLPLGESVSKHNVASQLGEADSFLALYRRLLRLRTRHAVLRHGAYNVLGNNEPDVFLYERTLGVDHVYVALNFSSTHTKVQLPHEGRVLCCTHPVDYPDISKENIVTLRPYEGVIFECKQHPLDEKPVKVVS